MCVCACACACACLCMSNMVKGLFGPHRARTWHHNCVFVCVPVSVQHGASACLALPHRTDKLAPVCVCVCVCMCVCVRAKVGTLRQAQRLRISTKLLNGHLLQVPGGCKIFMPNRRLYYWHVQFASSSQMCSLHHPAPGACVPHKKEERLIVCNFAASFTYIVSHINCCRLTYSVPHINYCRLTYSMLHINCCRIHEQPWPAERGIPPHPGPRH